MAPRLRASSSLLALPGLARVGPSLGIALTLALTGCPDDVSPGATAEDSGTGFMLTGGLTSGPSSASGTGIATDGVDGTQGSDGATANPADGTAGPVSGGTATSGDPNGGTTNCGNDTYACGDGIDNDGDGHIDLFDPECTGPCDDDESSFQTGIPGDNMDCKQDCFFDGNSGQGDDGCIWDLRCDPENPGEFIGCEYTGGNNCNNQPPNQDMDCIEFCEPFVPPGCDCFGCCEVQTPSGPIHIFLNSSPDCALDNLEACTECTSQIEDCGNPCIPEECQVCFGETEPPEGCDDPSCISGTPCETNVDCPESFFCYLGCCYPPPPG